jgi:hypothetical protein
MLQQFIQLLRENDVKGDAWGVTMAAFFDVASHTYEAGETPAEWQFNVGWGGNHIDTESYYYEFLTERTYNELIEIGNYLHRITAALERKGLSY